MTLAPRAALADQPARKVRASQRAHGIGGGMRGLAQPAAEQSAAEFLQRQLGNSALAALDGTLLQPSSCGCAGACGDCSGEAESVAMRPSLVVGAADDPYEQEADRMADQVMRTTVEGPASLQRQAEEPLEEEPLVNPLTEQIETLLAEEGVQAKSAGPGLSPTPEFASVLARTRGGGQPLPEPIRTEMEAAFGADFTDVRLHTDSNAAEMSRQINAHAFTHGRDIYFNQGTFAPSTSAGKHLLAHELTHTLQQNGDRISRLAITRNTRTALTCGGFNVRWTFTLDKPAASDGYMVQRVRQLETVAPCPSNVRGVSMAPRREFWEAWPINRNNTQHPLQATVGFTDSSNRPSAPNTSGLRAALGTIKFFLRSTTGDLGTYRTAPSDPASTWGPGKAPPSGILPSTLTEPSWWKNSPTEGPVYRWASSWWNCCGNPATARNDMDSNP